MKIHTIFHHTLHLLILMIPPFITYEIQSITDNAQIWYLPDVYIEEDSKQCHYRSAFSFSCPGLDEITSDLLGSVVTESPPCFTSDSNSLAACISYKHHLMVDMIYFHIYNMLPHITKHWTSLDEMIFNWKIANQTISHGTMIHNFLIKKGSKKSPWMGRKHSFCPFDLHLIFSRNHAFL